MKNIFIALIAGVLFISFVTLLVNIVQYVVTIYINNKENISGKVILSYGGLSITIGILIAIELYLIIM